MERVILHSDANSFYASVECLYRPEIRDKPVAVCGDPDSRHGIVLTKNQHAKRYGVKTGEAIWQAARKCPGLVVIVPHYDRYTRFSNMLRGIYESYTDRVESFGLDECWLDVSGKNRGMEYGRRLADEIRARVKDEIGVTVSIGVSFNKVFAKLGSDMKKPDATTVVSRENYKQTVWNLKAADMLFVGNRTMEKLLRIGVITIGDLACADEDLLRRLLGKSGLMIKTFAMGLEDSPVMPACESLREKSIGNSITPPRDIENMDDVKCMIYMLAESVGGRLRKAGLKGGTITLSVRKPSLEWFLHQRALRRETNLTGDIARVSLELYNEKFLGWLPLRGMGVQCQSLTPDGAPVQLDMLGETDTITRRLALDKTIDSLRERFGRDCVRRGAVLIDDAFKKADTLGDHINIASANYYK